MNDYRDQGRQRGPGSRPQGAQGRPPQRPAGQRAGRPSGPAGPARSARVNAEAAQRAALSSMNDRRPGQNPYARARREQGQLPRENRFAEEFFEDDFAEDTGMKRNLLIAGIAAASILLVLIIVLLIMRMMSSNSDVRLQKRTQQTSLQTTTMTAKRTTGTVVIDAGTVSTTLTPLGTDPYQHPPAWTPAPQTEPPTSQTEQPWQPSFAPPPAVVTVPQPVLTLPPEVPIPPAFDPNAGATDAPTAPPAVETPVPAPPPTEAPTAPPVAPEQEAINLPVEPQPERVLAPREVQGMVARLAGGFVLVAEDANGQENVISGTGNFDHIYTSVDNNHVIVVSGENYFLLDGVHDPIQLNVTAPQGIERMMGTNGFAYTMGNMLYYTNYADQQPVLISPNTVSALMARDVDKWLVSSEDGSVAVIDTAGNRQELLPAYAAQGSIRLTALDDNAKLAVFQDDAMVYVYHQNSSQVLQIPKAFMGEANVQRTPSGDETLISQQGAAYIIRVTKNGGVQQINLDNVLSANAAFLPAGTKDGNDYANLAIIDGTRLMLTNDSLMQDPSTGAYGTRVIEDNIKEACTGGQALYWIDGEGRVKAMNSSSSLVEAPPAAVLSSPGASQLTCNQDGSMVYYIENGTLMRRSNGQPAEVLLQGCSTYFIDRTGRRCYAVTSNGGLVRLVNGGTEYLANDGAGLTRENFEVNAMNSRGGNTWIGDGTFVWIENGLLQAEP